MMEAIGKYTVMIVISLLLTLLEYWLKSNYITDFFSSNAILLAGAIFAIHAASVGILLSQLEILKQRTQLNFRNTINGIRNSFREAIVWLIIIMIGAIIIRGLQNKECPLINFQYAQEIVSFIIIFATTALIAIVLDTVNAILICLEEGD
ncbi:hypothetical protein [uncultured Desulfovibrio sp.]|uniref:hypothetical protein n=1 Tax=uncultured Desulfovibrio sp. TaxID=167968 RepID=UPI00266F5FC2|nr:hypothetical protein [uncultured Desulfovibrio sp.]